MNRCSTEAILPETEEFTTDLHEVLAKCNAKMVKVFLKYYEDLTADQFYIQVAKFGKTLSDDVQAVMKSAEKQDDIIVGFKPTKHDILEIYEEVYALKHEAEGYSNEDLKSMNANFVNQKPDTAPYSEKKPKKEKASAGLSAPSSSSKGKRKRTEQNYTEEDDDDDDNYTE